MAAVSRFPSKCCNSKPFKPSDFRDIRAKWLSNVFVQDNSSRVKCSEVIAELNSAFEGILKRECGFVVRQCFPTVKRIHSNHVYYYSGVRRLSTAENLNPIFTDEANEKHSSSSIIQEIPRSMHINRSELQPPRKEKATYNFFNGNFSHLHLQRYRGIPVAVREYDTSIIDEAKAVLSLPSHTCFPVLIGVCCDKKPYLLVTMFYGNVSEGVYISVSGLLSNNTIGFLQWLTIVLGIAEGLLLMHSCGFVHGDLKADNIILIKMKSKLVPVFLNLDKAKDVDRETTDCLYQQDCSMFSCLVESIITSNSIKGSADLSDVNEVSQLVKVISNDADVSKIVTHLQKMLLK